MPLLLPAGLVTQLNNVANAAGVSPFMALLAVWQVRRATLKPIACLSACILSCCITCQFAAELAQLGLSSFSMLDPAE